MRSRLTLLVLLLGMFSGFAHAQSVTCESRGGGYRECYSGFRYSPVLVEQLSGSDCVEGESWGHRPGAIWVSDGCRGVFEEADRGDWAGGDEAGVVCESRDGRYRECPLPSRGPVELVDQLSSRPCVEGQSWGRNRGVIWVDQGCRARFAAYYDGRGGRGGRSDGDYSGGSHWQSTSDYSIECASREGRRNVCTWDWRSGTPFILEQLSSSSCVRERSWGYDRGHGLLWVDQGCRAIFGAR